MLEHYLSFLLKPDSTLLPINEIQERKKMVPDFTNVLSIDKNDLQFVANNLHLLLLFFLQHLRHPVTSAVAAESQNQRTKGPVMAGGCIQVNTPGALQWTPIFSRTSRSRCR